MKRQNAPVWFLSSSIDPGSGVRFVITPQFLYVLILKGIE